MKTYNIKVNGISYEVEVEEAGSSTQGNEAAARDVVKPAATPQAAPKAAAPKAVPASQTSAGVETISAPMPGTVLEVRVSPGQSVKSGDILLILEAMKMENEIMAPKDGVVGSVETTKGANVNAGDTLLTIG